MDYTPGPWIIWNEELELNPEFSSGPPVIYAPPESTGYDETVDICEVNADLDEYVANTLLLKYTPELHEAAAQLLDRLYEHGSIDHVREEGSIADLENVLAKIKQSTVVGGGSDNGMSILS